MSDRWSFLMIAGADGAEAQVRVRVEDVGSGASATAQFEVGGAEVDLDEAPVDYEAPEWKAKKIMSAAGVDDARFEALKRDVRGRLGS